MPAVVLVVTAGVPSSVNLSVKSVGELKSIKSVTDADELVAKNEINSRNRQHNLAIGVLLKMIF
jgi:hypothetical protein